MTTTTTTTTTPDPSWAYQTLAALVRHIETTAASTKNFAQQRENATDGDYQMGIADAYADLRTYALKMVDGSPLAS